MAVILITGNLEVLTEKALIPLAQEYKIVLAGKLELDRKCKNIVCYDTVGTESKFSRLFDAYSFQAVFYITGYVDGGKGTFGELQYLEGTMKECRRGKVDKFILLSTVESLNFCMEISEEGKPPTPNYLTGQAFSAAQAEDLCHYFAGTSEVKTIVLRLPYLVGRINNGNFLGKVFTETEKKENVVFPHTAEDRVDFISLRDLVGLLGQIAGETEDESGDYFVTSGYYHNYGELQLRLQNLVPDIQVVYEKRPDKIPWQDYPSELRRKYGFIPLDDVVGDIEEYYHIYKTETSHGISGIVGKFRKILGNTGRGVFQYIELLLVFLLAEVIGHYTSDSVYFKFVDVRLFYIMLMGTMHGMKLGLLAALLECFVLVRGFAQIGMDGTLLFYNVENWIPFAVYLMAGSITGYIKNKNSDELSNSQKEYALLRSKYIFLNDVYHSAIENKSEYKKQILGFKDSFGKIFDAVQKLDSQLPESIFLEGLKVMEDILENDTIAIYTLDSWQRFGRLVVCSNSQLQKLTKSIKIEDCRVVYDRLIQGEVWKNTDLKEGVPMYACGVFQDGIMVLMITIQEVSLEQYGMHYMNIFRILCGLVQTSLLRAMEYEKLQEDQLYFHGTHVVYPARLRQLVEVQEAMRDSGNADYVLARFEERDKKKISSLLNGIIRASDTIGADEDGNVYLLLSQTNQENFHIVGKRIDNCGLKYQLVEKVGSL